MFGLFMLIIFGFITSCLVIFKTEKIMNSLGDFWGFIIVILIFILSILITSASTIMLIGGNI